MIKSDYSFYLPNDILKKAQLTHNGEIVELWTQPLQLEELIGEWIFRPFIFSLLGSTDDGCLYTIYLKEDNVPVCD